MVAVLATRPFPQQVPCALGLVPQKHSLVTAKAEDMQPNAYFLAQCVCSGPWVDSARRGVVPPDAGKTAIYRCCSTPCTTAISPETDNNLRSAGTFDVAPTAAYVFG
jgi:hypothetical protein